MTAVMIITASCLLQIATIHVRPDINSVVYEEYKRHYIHDTIQSVMCKECGAAAAARRRSGNAARALQATRTIRDNQVYEV